MLVREGGCLAKFFSTNSFDSFTGKLDDNTVQQMEKSRCGMKDPRVKFKYTESGKARYRRFTLQGETWDFTSRPDVSAKCFS